MSRPPLLLVVGSLWKRNGSMNERGNEEVVKITHIGHVGHLNHSTRCECSRCYYVDYDVITGVVPYSMYYKRMDVFLIKYSLFISDEV